MRILVVTLITLMLFACGSNSTQSSAQKNTAHLPNNYVTKEGLYGTVKTVIITTYIFDNGVKTWKDSSQIEFDNKGRKISEHYNRFFRADSGNIAYSYDSLGRLAEEKEYDGGGQELGDREEMVYGYTATCVYTNVYRGSKLVAHRSLHYDDAGNLVCDSTVNINVGLLGTNVYTYDSDYHKLTERRYNFIQGHTAGVATTDHTADIVATTYHYNAKGYLDKITDSLNGNLRSILTVTCEGIDEHGNWHTLKKDRDSKPYAITERSIVYW